MADKNESLRSLSILADIKQTFSSPEGKRVLRYLMKRTGFLNTSFVAGDAYMSAFNEGQRAIIIDIVKKLKVDIRKLEDELLKEPEGDRDVII